MPKISVIMGVYNCKNYDSLKKSVDSIINQTFRDWELIICDDGSTNNTSLLLENIRKLDSRIKIISYEKNMGLAYALNHCLEHANGSYIARQDDDGDISSPERFQTQLDYLNTHKNVDYVGSNCAVFSDNGVIGSLIVPEFVSSKSFLWNSPYIHPAIMFRREALDMVNGYRVSKETLRCEDYDLFMRLHSAGCIGYNIQSKLYAYRLNFLPNKKYRTISDRWHETIVRFKGFSLMGILILGFPFVIKPLIVHFIPSKVFFMLKKQLYKRKQ